MRGFLRKMTATVPETGTSSDSPVQYSLRLDDEAFPLNPLMGSEIALEMAAIAMIHWSA